MATVETSKMLPDVSVMHSLRMTMSRQAPMAAAAPSARLAIARAFIADPVVIVMDEATGALDPSSEAAVLDGYERILRGRTTVLITHRLDLARQAERVVVIEDGRVQEDGPPSELEATGRVFRNLFLDALKG